MSDDLERRLRATLGGASLPPAPDTLRKRLRTIAWSPRPDAVPRKAFGNGSRLVLGLAAVLAVGGVIAVGALLSMRPTPPTVDGLPIMTVSVALAAHTAGTLPDGRAAVRGWWSDGSVGHSCGPSHEPVGELELYCNDGEWGITELDEPMFVVDVSSGLVTYKAKGPHLTPYVGEGIERVDQLFGLPIINGQRYPPVPIVVVGHFDDPRAADCRPAARQLCLDRLVLDRIAELDVRSVPTPGVTPSPTPFPSPGPPGLFGADACEGDVPYSFVGWSTTAALELPFDRPGHVWAMVTRDPVRLTDEGWQDDPNGSGHGYQIWGRRICIAEEGPGHEGEMTFGIVPGSASVLWDDGLRVPGDNPIRP